MTSVHLVVKEEHKDRGKPAPMKMTKLRQMNLASAMTMKPVRKTVYLTEEHKDRGVPDNAESPPPGPR